MSYILDALRKADAERSQSTGPLLTGLATPRSRGPAPAIRRSGATVRWAMALAALASLAALWWFTGSRQPPPPPPSVEAPMLPAVLPGPAQDIAPNPAPPPEAFVAATPAPPEPILAPEPPPPVRAPAPVSIESPPPGLMPGPDLASTPAAAVAQTPSPLVPAARATAVPASAPNGLNVSGATYSDNPAHRMLIINGKVVAEGQEVEPGLVLEVITPRSAVLNRGGSRFNINY